jgi:hypothetical protein
VPNLQQLFTIRTASDAIRHETSTCDLPLELDIYFKFCGDVTHIIFFFKFYFSLSFVFLISFRICTFNLPFAYYLFLLVYCDFT